MIAVALDAARGRLAGRRSASCRGASATRSMCSTRRRCAPRSTRRPTSAALWDADRRGAASIPRRLAVGLRAAALELGVRLHEHSAVTQPARRRRTVLAATALGHVRARRVLLGHQRLPAAAARDPPRTSCRSTTTCWSPSRSARRSATRSAGATGRGSATAANQFHYYRLTADDRILWGGYDAVYRFRGPASARATSSDDATFELLAQHFFDTFPQLDGPALHPPLGRRDRHLQPLLASSSAPRTAAASPTPPATPGSASAPTRFGARVALDLLDGRETEATRLRYVRSQAGAVPARAAALRRHPADPQPAGRAPTATRAAAGCGCGRSTASGSASTPRLTARRCRAAAASRAVRVEPVDLHLGPADHEVGVDGRRRSGRPRTAPAASARPSPRRRPRTRRRRRCGRRRSRRERVVEQQPALVDARVAAHERHLAELRAPSSRATWPRTMSASASASTRTIRPPRNSISSPRTSTPSHSSGRVDADDALGAAPVGGREDLLGRHVHDAADAVDRVVSVPDFQREPGSRPIVRSVPGPRNRIASNRALGRAAARGARGRRCAPPRPPLGSGSSSRTAVATASHSRSRSGLAEDGLGPPGGRVARR